MQTSVYVSLLFTGLFGLAAPPLGRRLPPASATWLLSVGGLLAASASTASLALLGFTLVGQNSLLADRGGWSDASLRQDNPVATPTALLALAALVVLGACAVRAAGMRLGALRDAYRLAAALPTAGGELAVLVTTDTQAFAVPGRPGRIVVTTGLLRGLGPHQRRAVLAHERSHLYHRHHLHQALGHLAAAVNPLLRRLPGAIELSCERWADEDAAASCRRDTVAEALVQAVTRTRRPASAVVLAAGVTHVTTRVGALRVPPPSLKLWRVGLIVGLVLASGVAVANAAHDTEHLFERAQYAYRSGHHPG